MDKKAQVTLFVILGIVIVAAIGVGIYAKNAVTKSASEKEAGIAASLPPDLVSIRKEIAECTQSIFEEAVIEAGKYGGYNSPLENSLEAGDTFVTYGYFEGQKLLPSLEAIEADIAEYVETYLPDCVDFTAYGKFTITPSNPKATIDILKDKVSAEVEYKISAEREGTQMRIDEPYYADAKVRLLSIRDTASKIVDKAAENAEEINIDGLLELGEDINLVPIDEKTAVYSIEDKGSKLIGLDGEQSFVYVFATKAK